MYLVNYIIFFSVNHVFWKLIKLPFLNNCNIIVDYI